jgi:hypothetical protein
MKRCSYDRTNCIQQRVVHFFLSSNDCSTSCTVKRYFRVCFFSTCILPTKHFLPEKEKQNLIKSFTNIYKTDMQCQSTFDALFHSCIFESKKKKTCERNENHAEHITDDRERERLNFRASTTIHSAVSCAPYILYIQKF